MRLLGLFVKAWRPGAVKTRLARVTSPWGAALWYARLVRWMIQRWAEVGDVRWLVFTPPSTRRLWLRLAGDRWGCEPQAEGDLGQRLERFFQVAHRRNGTRVLAVGSDSPMLADVWLETAWQELLRVPVVLGPAEDGGYYLIGLNTQWLTDKGIWPDLWSDIPWSSDQVFATTVERLVTRRIPFATLPTGYDVDTYADLERLVQEMEVGAWGRSMAARFLVRSKLLRSTHQDATV